MEAYTKYQVRRGKKITDDFKKALDILNYMFETIPKKYAA